MTIERIARLCATSVRFSVEAPGGFALYSDADYAAALGMVSDPFGADLLEHLIGAGDQLTTERIRRRLASDQFKEIDRQTREVQKRSLELRIAEDNKASKRHVTEEDRRIVATARAELERAKAATWPEDAEVMNALRRAVLDEFRDPHKCPCCDGRATFREDELVVECVACKGTGKLRPSDSSRADALGRDRANYLRRWRAPYNWSLSLLEDAKEVAEREFLDALR